MSWALKKPLHDRHTASFLETIVVKAGKGPGYVSSMRYFPQAFKVEASQACRSARRRNSVEDCDSLIGSKCNMWSDERRIASANQELARSSERSWSEEEVTECAKVEALLNLQWRSSILQGEKSIRSASVSFALAYWSESMGSPHKTLERSWGGSAVMSESRHTRESLHKKPKQLLVCSS